MPPFSQSAQSTASGARRLRRRRAFKDWLARNLVRLGGIGVIIAVSLICFYLIYVVAPLFAPAAMERLKGWSFAPAHPTLALDIEEQNRIGFRLLGGGRVAFFDVRTGETLKRVMLPLPEGARITAVARSQPNDNRIALGLTNGRALVFAHEYQVSFPEGVQTITPQIAYPLGKDPVVVDPQGKALTALAFATDDRSTALVGYTQDRRLVLTRFEKSTNFLTGELTLERERYPIADSVPGPRALFFTDTQTFIYLISREGVLSLFDLRDLDAPALVQREPLLEGDARVTAAQLLLGGTSLLVGTSTGEIAQYFPVRDEQNRYHLQRIREFPPMPAAVTALEPESRRRGFVAGDAGGHVGIYASTADNRVLLEKIADAPVKGLAISPRANRLLIHSPNGMILSKVENAHPEVSWSSLWQAVWYEGYEKPRYIWQSSGASSANEPKFSLSPLTFGTLKGAFYAMLFAVPLALMGAIYTAQFMAPRLRRTVKPTIEIMEALPTVILGFLAGLWLAPYVEDNLAGVLALLVFTPLGLLGFAALWSRLPARLRQLMPPGWRPVLLIPVVIAIAWGSLALGRPLEQLFFGGAMREWLIYELGVDFNQRNALVVGFAMGFAVIPTIFSIAEDAVFSVPKSLSQGSLALGATHWQTLTRVVLPTASPGIFSALMIGLGRAVGETMIVLMATGNTAIMDFNIFEGMRTLSANVAIELPEAAVGSTHFRILFLTALLLFLFTFVVNTAAELIRQRLRRKYGRI